MRSISTRKSKQIYWNRLPIERLIYTCYCLTLYCTHYFIARRQIRCIKSETLCNRGLTMVTESWCSCCLSVDSELKTCYWTCSLRRTYRLRLGVFFVHLLENKSLVNFQIQLIWFSWCYLRLVMLCWDTARAQPASVLVACRNSGVTLLGVISKRFVCFMCFPVVLRNQWKYRQEIIAARDPSDIALSNI